MLNVIKELFIKKVDNIKHKLDFPENTFDCITIGFGLRNVTDKDAALKSIYKSLKPGGKSAQLIQLINILLFKRIKMFAFLTSELRE